MYHSSSPSRGGESMGGPLPEPTRTSDPVRSCVCSSFPIEGNQWQKVKLQIGHTCIIKGDIHTQVFGITKCLIASS